MLISQRLFLFLILLYKTTSCFSQTDLYSFHINIAKQYLYEMNYSKSVEFYSKAFSCNNNLGRVEDRYDAAKCWAVLGNFDSAFYQLDKCVKGKFKEYFSILSAPEFDLIKKEPKWSILLQLIKENKIEIELKRISIMDSLNLNLAFTLDSMHYVDQNNRIKLAELESRYGGSKNQKNILIAGDSINELKIIEILDENGWLGSDKIGEKAKLDSNQLKNILNIGEFNGISKIIRIA